VQTAPESDPVTIAAGIAVVRLVAGGHLRVLGEPPRRGGEQSFPRLDPSRRLRSTLDGTLARSSATSAAPERRAHHEQPVAGTRKPAVSRARRPSGRQDRFAHHAAPLICRAACFQESSRIPTTDARSMCPSIQGSKPDVRAPFFAPAVALLRDLQNDRAAARKSARSGCQPITGATSICGPRDANPVRVLRSRGHSAAPPTPG
jgi:hypothetical protein